MPPKASLKPPVIIPPIDHSFKDRDQRYFGDVPRLVNSRDKGYQREASALRDEVDMLQEENEIVLEKLHRAEEMREAAEARARELEKQVLAYFQRFICPFSFLVPKRLLLLEKECLWRLNC
jgi:hypothetical protein